MEDRFTKLRPDRDLQCYFLQPSAIAALSGTSPTGFTLSGCWRQQADWAVLEWNRDNVFEHPLFRNLPDGDLSGIHLSYQESRTNCVPIDSLLWPTVDWPYLRVWAESAGDEVLYQVPLARYATPITGNYTAPTAQFQLNGVLTPGDYIELSWLDQHFNHLIGSNETIAGALTALAGEITANRATAGATAAASGNQIVVTYLGMPGTNANRAGIYATVHGASTESWSPASAVFSGATSPTTWQIDLDFGALMDVKGQPIPTTNVRKLRWTWAADLQPASFQRTEFAVVVCNWTVDGKNFGYTVAGPGSRRIEDDSAAVKYQGSWTSSTGNFSGGSIHWTTTPDDAVSCTYAAQSAHTLYLGSRYADSGAHVTVQIDELGPQILPLQLTYLDGGQRVLSGDDVLSRIALAELGAGTHTVTISHTGSAGSYFYFDFLEVALPATALPWCATAPKTSLATDWDTLHSIAIAPERTAWMIQALGFRGRVNHYTGALWFYELAPSGFAYGEVTVSFTGQPEFGKITTVTVAGTPISHINLIGDTAASIATCFALLINAGSTAVRAQANGASLTITARMLGAAGNGLPVSIATNSSQFTGGLSGESTTGGRDGKWVTDLNADPALNRACRDWSVSFFRALAQYGLPVTASFSMELGNGDDSTEAGIAQRYPDGSAAWVNTPALQTNFSPVSTAYWQRVYAAMAGLMNSAGVAPYLQFGEVQWWYFAGKSGMPFYDAYTTGAFSARYGRPMAVIPDQNVNPQGYPDECGFLPTLIGEFTRAVTAAVRQVQPQTRFEVLYPPDVNDTPLNRQINFPATEWTPGNLACLKTENFTYTGNRDLDQCLQSIELPAQLGFPPAQTSHLIGISDYTTPWSKERQRAIAAGVESVVLFALDQFCLIGYNLPLDRRSSRSRYLG